jgi:hypothetical protein
VQLVEALRHKTFQVQFLVVSLEIFKTFNPHSLAWGSTQPLTEIKTKSFIFYFFVCWEGGAHRADIPAVLVVLNITVRLEAQKWKSP